MALKRQYDSEADVPEQYFNLYVEKDGKWVLDAEPSEGERHAEDVRKALAARDNERETGKKIREDHEKLLSQLEGIDLENLPEVLNEIRSTQSDKEETKRKELLDAQRFEEAAEQKFHRQIAEMTREIEQLRKSDKQKAEALEQLNTEFSTKMIDEALQRAFLEAGGDPKRAEYAVFTLRNAWEFDKEGKKPVPITKLHDGSVVTAIGSDGEPLTMKEQVTTFLRDDPWLMLNSSGSDSSHQSRNGGVNRFAINESQMRGGEGQARYRRLKAEAEKAGTEVEIIPGR